MGQALRKNKNCKESNEVLKIESKEEYFIHNGGILLEKRIAIGLGKDSGTGRVKILSAKDIENATNCYDYEPDFICTAVIDCVLYKATLKGLDVSICAARKLKPNPELVNRFLSEASITMVMNHENILGIYGCCLETCTPIIVYHNMGLQNLYRHLHGQLASSKNLKWIHLLVIAAEASYALSYMHSAFPKPVVHRDLNSHAIFLDDSFHVKLCGFGNSVSITPGSTPQKWPVKGVPGYLDPEYVGTQEVTEKCDVYSFGVLMLEMLTRRHPPTMSRNGLDLVDVFVLAVGENRMMEIIDSDVLEQVSVDEIEQFAHLALTCVAKKGTERPTMVEVTSKLWQIQGHHSK